LIEINDVSVVFNSKKQFFKAVDSVSLKIEKGEIFGIVGESGAGKSTLLRTLNLLERPTKGTILLDKKEITNLKGEELRKERLEIGMIFQNFNLIKGKTVYKNIEFAMKAAGKDKGQIDEKINELLEIVGLSDKKNAYPSKLSGGQKQRVGIARALANEPKILLCDEPTSALDLETTESILELLKEINQRLGITIVIITHEMDVVKKICNKVAVMKEGKVIEEGEVYEIFANPKEDFTKKLVQNSLKLEIPKNIYLNYKGKIIKILYKGNEALEPVLYNVSKKFDVEINLLHGQIEYISENPIGVMIVGINGNEKESKLAIDYIEEKTARTEVLYDNGNN
jgi:D-methionine transport system ATP-binding protein